MKWIHHWHFLIKKIRNRRQNSIPEYQENAGERFVDNAYDYEYDPNLKLTTPLTQDDLKQGSGLVGDGSNGNSEMSPEDETMPMTDEERAYLEEHYRYQITIVTFNFSSLIFSDKSIIIFFMPLL